MSRKTTVTTGTFDGVHLGHRMLLRELGRIAASSATHPLVLVLSPHPLTLVAPDRAPALLTTPQDRIGEIRRILPEADVRTLRFDESLRSLTHREFMAMLRDEFGASGILLGHDNRFGSDIRATSDDYRESASALGLSLCFCDALPGVSSSNVRKSLLRGDATEAMRMLGRPYVLKGRVGHGHRLGRTIGFPTANLIPDDAAMLVPASGVYAVYAVSGGKAYKAIVNIGVRPTVDRSAVPAPSIEAHILDFDGDLYGKPLELHFYSRLRDEKCFPDLDALALQLRADADAAATILPDSALFLNKHDA